jgi:hypothetical protein
MRTPPRRRQQLIEISARIPSGGMDSDRRAETARNIKAILAEPPSPPPTGGRGSALQQQTDSEEGENGELGLALRKAHNALSASSCSASSLDDHLPPWAREAPDTSNTEMGNYRVQVRQMEEETERHVQQLGALNHPLEVSSIDTTAELLVECGSPGGTPTSQGRSLVEFVPQDSLADAVAEERERHEEASRKALDILRVKDEEIRKLRAAFSQGGGSRGAANAVAQLQLELASKDERLRAAEEEIELLAEQFDAEGRRIGVVRTDEAETTAFYSRRWACPGCLHVIPSALGSSVMLLAQGARARERGGFTARPAGSEGPRMCRGARAVGARRTGRREGVRTGPNE